MRSRASRRRLSDHDIRCSASDRRWFPARPAQHVHRRRNNGKGPNTIGTPERAWQKRQKTRRDIQRRTRRSASTIGGAAPDTIIGRAVADRAGARPYRLQRPRLIKSANLVYRLAYMAVPKSSVIFPDADTPMRRHASPAGSNPRLLCLTNVYFGQRWTWYTCGPILNNLPCKAIV